MASRALKNTLAIVATANGIAITIRRHTRAVTPTRLADALESACEAAFDCWPGELGAKDVVHIHDWLSKFEGTRIPEYGRPELMTSIVLGLVDDLLEKIRDPVKRTALGKIEDALFRVHQYYDRKLDRHDTYEYAGQCIEHWRQEMAT